MYHNINNISERKRPDPSQLRSLARVQLKSLLHTTEGLANGTLTYVPLMYAAFQPLMTGICLLYCGLGEYA